MAANAVSQECDDTEFLTCPVCLELFIKPVMLDCGHNFCKSCIEKVWDSSDKVLACPECREEFQTRKYSVNWLLAKQVEAVILRTGSTEGNSEVSRSPNTAFCVQHEEKLKLFCKEDETLVCIICRDSAKHAGHSFLPMDEAASLHRGKITTAQADLQPRLQELVELQTKQEQKILDIKAVSNISELCNSVEQTGSIYKPDLICGKLSFWHFTGPLQYSVWKEMKPIISPVPSSLFLKYNMPHRSLVVSQDLTSVMKTDKNMFWKAQMFEMFEMKEYYSVVLACQGFSSGRHYWEVEVGDKTGWVLGVAAKSVIKEGRIPRSITFGHWAICLTAGSKYCTCGQVPELLSLNINPHKIGVYLDYEGGQISFYNADNMTHIHTFSDTFKECLYPSLSLDCGHYCSKPLKLFHLKL
ncbi:zinc-binding protein A33-like [Protopterus annectens]|uniref:zinc-binding protein A33-like n=1 Tax=Protopterus annectens TaxID=7888 RepID=UPI001CFB515A|nr:zinc-binding protein A33-like [Protopterus annectens]